MKRALFLLLIVCYTTACDDDDSNNNPSNTKADEAQSIAMEGQWRITFFEDSGDNETGSFNGYIFEFGSNNLLTTSNGSNNYAGTWSVTDDDSRDDDNDYDDIDFNIAFSSPRDFEELSEDWEIVSISNSKIELKHVSGGNGGTDLLTFEKV